MVVPPPCTTAGRRTGGSPRSEASCANDAGVYQRVFGPRGEVASEWGAGDEFDRGRSVAELDTSRECRVVRRARRRIAQCRPLVVSIAERPGDPYGFESKSPQCMPLPPDSCLTSSPTTALASPNSIQVLSA